MPPPRLGLSAGVTGSQGRHQAGEPGMLQPDAGIRGGDEVTSCRFDGCVSPTRDIGAWDDQEPQWKPGGVLLDHLYRIVVRTSIYEHHFVRRTGLQHQTVHQTADGLSFVQDRADDAHPRHGFLGAHELIIELKSRTRKSASDMASSALHPRLGRLRVVFQAQLADGVLQGDDAACQMTERFHGRIGQFVVVQVLSLEPLR
jgi:hypothetical protein